MSRGPARMPLTPRQAQALTVAATGVPLREVGEQLGITREHASSLISRAYERLGVKHVPRPERRAAAVRAAVARGLITVQSEENSTK
ncbi:sigma factor-like helix-turn-helix DNA-binding protein [Streptomyces sp. AC04842]|uniref:sigma factor-like helix-turn-helix DNA-binding protein n=1 Tax=Streptomyces sp. AC04842 TaxID=2775327 RepID=UPI0020C6E10B|nr:hypothetical protein [Streptomyces sp. AC04842]